MDQIRKQTFQGLGFCKRGLDQMFFFVCFFGVFFWFFIGVQLIYNVVLVSAVQQSESVIYIYPLFFRFFSHIGDYRVLSRVPCAIQQVLISYLFYIQQYVYVNPNLPIYPSPRKQFFLINLFYFIYFWLHWVFVAVHGLSLVAASGGLLFVAVRRPLIVVASLVTEHGIQACSLRQLWLTGSRAQAQQLWRTGLVAPWHVGVFRDQGSNPCPLHWQANS